MQRVRAPRLLAPDMSDGACAIVGCMLHGVRCPLRARIALRPSNRLLRSFEYFFFSSSRSGCMKLHDEKIHTQSRVPSDAHTMPYDARKTCNVTATADCVADRSLLTSPIAIAWYTSDTESAQGRPRGAMVHTYEGALQNRKG